MFSQNTINKITDTINQNIPERLIPIYNSSLNYLSKLLFGDLPALLENRFPNNFDDQNTRIARVGPPFLGFNIAEVNFRSDDVAFNDKQLKTIMDLEEPNARSPYEIFNRITGCDFIIAKGNAEGIPLHKDFARYLNLKNIAEKCKAKTADLLAIYATAAEPGTHLEASETFIKNIYFEAILGLEPTPELTAMFLKIERALTITQFMLPNFLQPFNSSAQKLRAEVNQVCMAFIKLRAEEIKELLNNNIDNMFTAYVKTVLPAKQDWSSLSEAELELIGNHTLIRGALFSLFPIGNAANTTAFAIYFAMQRLTNTRVLNLAEHLRAHPEFNISNLKPKFSTIIEALYIDGLRISKFDNIMRYTKNGINTPELQIPPHTLIQCNLTEYAENQNFEKLFAGRNFYLVFYKSSDLPSEETCREIIETENKKQKDPVVRPLIIRLDKDEFFIYGKTSANTWKINYLGKNWDMGGICEGVVHDYPTYMTPKNFIETILEHNAHIPFEEPETLEFKIGSSRMAFFGKGSRSCPAAATVGRVTKELLVATLREYKNYPYLLFNSQQRVGVKVSEPAVIETPTLK